MQPVINLLVANPLLLLFIVAAIGYPLGRIKIGGFSLGISAVLFVGLAIGSLDAKLALPDFVYLLGLVLFVYTIGLSSAPGFFAALKRRGLRDNLFVAGMLVAAGAVTFVASQLFNLNGRLTAGLYAGSLTNTPALAGVIESLKNSLGDAATKKMLSEPTVAYSVAYPMGVIAMLLAVHFGARLFKIDYKAEAKAGGSGDPITHRSVRITRVEDARVGDLAQKYERRVLFGRLKHSGAMLIPDVETRLHRGDVVSIIGADDDVTAVIAELGEPADEALELERSDLDFRRVFVSDSRIAGQRVGNLHLPQLYGAIITRVRRGDVDLLPNGDTVLELGDRVRVLCPRENMTAISKFFGDSYKAVSEVDIMTLGVGIAVGLLLGSIPLPLPGGTTFKLGSAAGPLIVSLILGALGRTGPILWQLPYSANLTLRQFGLTIFLAGIGTKAGFGFASSVGGGTGLYLFAAGTVITAGAAIITLWVGYRLLKIPYATLTGMLAALQTQPAVLAFANEKAGNEMPNVGYATVYPVAMIVKIIIAQVLLAAITK